MGPDYARLAYEAYAEHQGWKNYQGHPIPTWDMVRQDIKDAWWVVTGTVINVYDAHIAQMASQQQEHP